MSNPKDALLESTWNDVRYRLDELGNTIHRVEDAQTRLAFIRLVESVQAYEDMKKL